MTLRKAELSGTNLFVEAEDGRMFILKGMPGEDAEWIQLPPLPMTEEQREREALHARARKAGLTLDAPE